MANWLPSHLAIVHWPTGHLPYKRAEVLFWWRDSTYSLNAKRIIQSGHRWNCQKAFMMIVCCTAWINRVSIRGRGSANINRPRVPNRLMYFLRFSTRPQNEIFAILWRSIGPLSLQKVIFFSKNLVAFSFVVKVWKSPCQLKIFVRKNYWGVV